MLHPSPTFILVVYLQKSVSHVYLPPSLVFRLPINLEEHLSEGNPQGDKRFK